MRIEIEFRNVYGNRQIYPINKEAKAIAQIAGTKTLCACDLLVAKEMLGAQIVEIHNNNLKGSGLC